MRRLQQMPPLVPGDVVQWSPSHHGLVLGPLRSAPHQLLFLEVQRDHAQLRPLLPSAVLPRMPVGAPALRIAQQIVMQETELLRQAQTEADLQHLARQFVLPSPSAASAPAPAPAEAAPAASPVPAEGTTAAAPTAAPPAAPSLFPPLLSQLGRSAASGPIGPGIL